MPENAVGFKEAIQNGLGIINRNWQLVAIQVGAMFASFLGFFVLVGIPLAVAFIIFGLDLTELSRIEDIFRTFREPAEILSKYFALVVLVLTSLLLYATAVLSLGIFLFGGSIGVIGRSMEGNLEKFHMKVFLSEGKRLFFPLVGFTTLIGLIFVLVAFVLGLFGGMISAVVSIAKEQEATLALFLGIFFSLILFVIGLALILVTLSLTVYGSAVMAMKGPGPMKAIREAARYLHSHANAFYFYCLVFFAYLFISFVVLSLGYPIGLIPLIGSPMAVLYQFAAYVIQSYLGLALIATLFSYYFYSTKEIGPAEAHEQDSGPTPEGPGHEEGTAGPQAPGQDILPPEKEPSSER
ncbi:MAG: hypothetical protein M1497_11110 [Nitrospirae bacterium]|nr:hypothetical protein [Nitrospirota bacterium]